MPQVPSTRWTAFDVLSSSRELAKTVDQKKVVQEQGKYFYKIALSEIVTLLNSSLDPSYHTSVALTVIGDNANISDVLYDRIISIEDTNVGQCVEVGSQEFASLGRLKFQHKSYGDDIVWCLYGNTIRFKNGDKITPGTKTMWYQRQPVYPVDFSDTEYVDLADKWIPLLIMKIYTLMILQNEPDIPKNIAQEMQTYYQLIPGFNQAETQNKVKDAKQITIK
jgi:hypothetical protein